MMQLDTSAAPPKRQLFLLEDACTPVRCTARQPPAAPKRRRVENEWTLSQVETALSEHLAKRKFQSEGSKAFNGTFAFDRQQLSWNQHSALALNGEHRLEGSLGSNSIQGDLCDSTPLTPQSSGSLPELSQEFLTTPTKPSNASASKAVDLGTGKNASLPQPPATPHIFFGTTRPRLDRDGACISNRVD